MAWLHSGLSEDRTGLSPCPLLAPHRTGGVVPGPCLPLSFPLSPLRGFRRRKRPRVPDLPPLPHPEPSQQRASCVPAEPRNQFADGCHSPQSRSVCGPPEPHPRPAPPRPAPAQAPAPRPPPRERVPAQHLPHRPPSEQCPPQGPLWPVPTTCRHPACCPACPAAGPTRARAPPPWSGPVAAWTEQPGRDLGTNWQKRLPALLGSQRWL